MKRCVVFSNWVVDAPARWKPETLTTLRPHHSGAREHATRATYRPMLKNTRQRISNIIIFNLRDRTLDGRPKPAVTAYQPALPAAWRCRPYVQSRERTREEEEEEEEEEEVGKGGGPSLSLSF